MERREMEAREVKVIGGDVAEGHTLATLTNGDDIPMNKAELVNALIKAHGLSKVRAALMATNGDDGKLDVPAYWSTVKAMQACHKSCECESERCECESCGCESCECESHGHDPPPSY